MRFRIWRERQTRVLPLSGDGPLAVHEGEVVVVAVVDSLDAALDALKEIEGRQRGKR